MQTPALTSSTSSAIYSDSRLIRLWRNWLGVAGSIPLDKWLKNNLRELAGIKKGTEFNKGNVNNNLPQGLSLEDQAGLTQAMNNALRFQQLACVLETLYQEYSRLESYPDIDWLHWDERWQVRDLLPLSPAAFWFWIQLRVTNDLTKRNLTQLRDAKQRGDFFLQLQTSHYFSQHLKDYLWMGLRPQWKILINERQVASSWSDENTAVFLERQTTTPPIWLRIQSHCSPEEIHANLLAQHVNAGLHAQFGIYVNGGKGINSTTEYKNGAIEIQDLASQLIARAVDVQPGQKVWDTCAGAGGKTLAIAARMDNKGAVISTDLHAYKLDELKRRVKRANIFNVRTFTWDGTAPLRLPKEVAQQQGFDWVLIDAPCSSSGTWRRNPDARWRFDAADTQELLSLQQKILLNAAPGVRRGGALVYATCSWQVSENEGQVNWFLSNHSQFELQSQRILGAPELDADTMFVAVLRRK
ncbi:MAG TPA: RsmB/NOP family class I SAM-dependent RNA methyltransferase [Cellvibrio sp.]|nr:RsmB/NOP family class I SAM-dependent RNA methyltransferase [Cellvibrio sp.]